MVRWLALLVLATLLVAGCGGTDKDDYESGLSKVQSHLDAATTASQDAAGVDVSDEDRRAALATARDELEAAADAADELDPPSDVADANEQLAEALADYADLFGRLAEADPASADSANLYAEAGAIVDRLNEASAELEEAGYEVSGGDS